MNTGSINVSRRDEWSALLLSVMKTSLSVAHKLGLSPDAVLDCAARHLRFRDFASFASGIHGASRADACCARRENISAIELAYIKRLASRVDEDRNVLAQLPTTGSMAIYHHLEASDKVYEKVSAAILALKNDVLHAFSQHGSLSDRAIAGVSGLARALAAIAPADEYAQAYERAVTALLVVRFATQNAVVVSDITGAENPAYVNANQDPLTSQSAQGAWMQRVKEVVRHPARLHK